MVRVQQSAAASASEHSTGSRSAAGALDGRVARRRRGRAAAIEAVLELFDDGDLRPSAEAVVSRAGISTASLFRYFDGLAELYRAAFDEQVARAEVIARVDGLDAPDLDGRVAAFVSGRTAVYRSVVGVGRMARARAIDDPGIARGLDLARGRWLAQVRVVFRSELSTLPRARREELAAVIDAVASFETWDLLVHGRGLAASCVEAHWANVIRALLV